MTLELIQGLLLAFALVVILMPPYVRLLRHFGYAKQIREEGPQSHMTKWGTPTMGGLLVLVVVVAVFVVLRWPVQGGVIAPLATLAFVGLLGAADDYLNARTGEGIRARQKLLWQTVVAVVVAWQIQSTYALSGFRVPFVGDVTIDPMLYVAFAAFAIVAASNGVNITDGLDGLAGGTLVFAFVSYLIIALLNVPQQPNVAFLCALLIGALLGFLWFNVHPAARGDRADHGPDPRPAADRPGVRRRDGLGHRPGRLLQAHRRPAHLPDGAPAPPLRAGWLGRGEDHAPVLDHRHPRRPAGRHPVPGLDQCAGMT
jgi:UDP-N-acetylmuramyl pentapeptide phosphotransferase/UDP-N-acetylglucosamine-1-phosphate transferase